MSEWEEYPFVTPNNNMQNTKKATPKWALCLTALLCVYGGMAQTKVTLTF